VLVLRLFAAGVCVLQFCLLLRLFPLIAADRHLQRSL
jgi:hypothetical protein